MHDPDLSRPRAVTVVDVDDPDDPRLDDFRDLSNVDRRPDLAIRADGSAGRGLVIAEGTLVAQRMIASRFVPHAFLGVDKRLRELAEPLTSPALAGVPFYRTTAAVMAEVVGFHLNRGVLAAAHRPPQQTVAEVVADAETVVVLEGVNDHENIGSIFRNAAGLGVDAVIFGAGCADPLYRRCVRVSMGHALLVPFARSEEWPGDLDVLREHGFATIALTPGQGSISLAQALPDAKVAFLVGAEGPGLTSATMARCDVRARIPMTRGTDSLNVATAAAVAFYERISRRA